MRGLLALVSTIVLVDTIFYSAITPLLPFYSEQLGLDKGEAGLLGASYAIGTLVAAVPAGLVATRIGVRRTVLLGLALLGASSVVFGFARSLVLLDAARAVEGIGGAFSWAGALAWLVRAAPAERRGELLGSAMAAAIVGAPQRHPHRDGSRRLVQLIDLQPDRRRADRPAADRAQRHPPLIGIEQ